MTDLSDMSRVGQLAGDSPVRTGAGTLPRSGQRAHRWPLVAAVAFAATALTVLVLIENQKLLGLALAAIAAICLGAARFGGVAATEAAAADHPWLLRGLITAATLAVLFVLRDDNFGLLMLSTVLIYATVCVGLTIQMGYAGLTNFAAAAFVGTGGYTAAMLGQAGGLPDPVVLVTGGLVAVAIGSLLILPVLRTRGHYAALTTLAFGVMFNVFLDANELLGGPQGLKIPGINLFGWDFSEDLHIAGFTISFYANYVLLTGALAALAMMLAGLIDRSWIGIWFDAVRLDETAASVFGLKIGRWKILAFTLGNFLAGVMGAVYAKMTGFIAPSNFTFGDSLVMVSIVILGGIGNRWGVLPAALIVVLLPEKLQFIQEYRLLLYALLVIVILIVRPDGLVARRVRKLNLEARS
ncbi:branched-chain amino acid ABC transporter permease [Phreatobacter stygius]|nr:branched-chain amino acid ABC transporter permease [Phreatobacter stygius]